MVNYLNFLREIDGVQAKKNCLTNKNDHKNDKTNKNQAQANLNELFYQMKRIEEVKRNDFLYFIKGFDTLNKGVVPFAHFISALNIAGLFLENEHETLIMNEYTTLGLVDYKRFLDCFRNYKRLNTEEHYKNLT